MNLAPSMITRACKHLLPPLRDSRGVSTVDYAFWPTLVVLLLIVLTRGLFSLAQYFGLIRL